MVEFSFVVLYGTRTVHPRLQNHGKAFGRSTGRYVYDFQQNDDVQARFLSTLAFLSRMTKGFVGGTYVNFW